jgi:hypothetical protein
MQRSGAWYHLTARCNERRPIYRDPGDRMHFCELLAEAVARYQWSSYRASVSLAVNGLSSDGCGKRACNAWWSRQRKPANSSDYRMSRCDSDCTFHHAHPVGAAWYFKPTGIAQVKGQSSVRPFQQRFDSRTGNLAVRAENQDVGQDTSLESGFPFAEACPGSPWLRFLSNT